MYPGMATTAAAQRSPPTIVSGTPILVSSSPRRPALQASVCPGGSPSVFEQSVPRGSGPFVVDVQPNGHLRLRGVRFAPRGAPYLREVQVVAARSSGDELRAFELGELDLAVDALGLPTGIRVRGDHRHALGHRQGNDVGASYRSAIFYTNDEQKRVADHTIADVDASGLWPGKVVTEVTLVSDFWEAEPEHQDYLERIPHGYTCHFVRPDWVLPKRAAAE